MSSYNIKKLIKLVGAREIGPHHLRAIGARGLEYYYKSLVTYNTYKAKREFDYVADPFKLIYVDPQDIEFVTFQFNRRKDTGKVVPGNWDLNNKKTTIVDDFQNGSLRMYDGYHEHFTNNVPWENTTFYQRAVERIEQGERIDSTESVAEFDAYLTKMDRVYNDMMENRYKSMYELTGPEHAASGFLRSLLDDVVVVITRDGTIWRAAGGRHRHILAKLLDLDEMAVRVAVRHHKWQETRDEYFNGVLKNKYDHIIGHPDLDDYVQ